MYTVLYQGKEEAKMEPVVEQARKEFYSFIVNLKPPRNQEVFDFEIWKRLLADYNYNFKKIATYFCCQTQFVHAVYYHVFIGLFPERMDNRNSQKTRTVQKWERASWVLPEKGVLAEIGQRARAAGREVKRVVKVYGNGSQRNFSRAALWVDEKKYLVKKVTTERLMTKNSKSHHSQVNIYQASLDEYDGVIIWQFTSSVDRIFMIPSEALLSWFGNEVDKRFYIRVERISQKPGYKPKFDSFKYQVNWPPIKKL